MLRTSTSSYIAELCGVHQHARCKTSLPGLPFHISRAFSGANLIRMPTQQDNIHRVLKLQIKKCRRILEPPPENVRGDLRTFCNVLFRLDADHHKRKHGKVSEFVQDINHLCNNNNSGLLGEWRHYCKHPVTGVLCHKTDEEFEADNQVASYNALYGRMGDIPCASKWTNTLPSLKMNLLRFGFYDVGPQAFSFDGANKAEAANLNDKDMDYKEFCKAMEANRVQRFSVYAVATS